MSDDQDQLAGSTSQTLQADSTASSTPPPRNGQTGSPAPTRTSRSSSEHARKSDKLRSRERSRTRDLAKLLLYEEREARDLTQAFAQLKTEFNRERDRADEAERHLVEVLEHIRVVNDARMSAAAQAAHAREELAMYKVRLADAEQEIRRAQKMLEDLDKRRFAAEEEAAKMRDLVREMREDRLVHNAREEGRQMGINEGLRTRGLVLERHRSRGPAPSATTASDEDSEYEEASESQSQSSHAPSISQMSRMSVPLRTPYLTPAAGPAPTVPNTPAPEPPLVQTDTPRNASSSTLPHNGSTPVLTRNASPLSHHSHHSPYTVPPDGWIPEADRDSFIHLPPPHELSRAILSPDVSPQPAAPIKLAPEPTRSIPPTPGPSRAHVASPESASTTLSDFEMVQPSMRRPSVSRLDPHQGLGPKSPLSVINEVLSVNSASPAPRPIPAPSLVTQAEQYYRRPLSSSSSSSDEPPRSKPRSKHGSQPSSSSIPDINILPPSRPESGLSPKSRPKMPLLTKQHSEGSLLLSGSYSDAHPSPKNIPRSEVHGAYDDGGGYLNSPGTYTSHAEPPVIPDLSLRKRSAQDTSYDTEESPSSLGTLASPPRYHHNFKLNSPVTPLSEARYPLPPSTPGASTIYTEARVPLPASTLGVLTPKTNSNLGLISRSRKGPGSVTSSRR